MPKLTKAQHKVLAFYIDMGPTTASYGAMSTWRSLIRKGYLARSSGPGFIETEATDAGRAALQQKGGSVVSRREMRLNGRKGADGLWSFTKYRVRSTVDFVRIVEFPRCPAAARAIAQGWLDAAVKEARRYAGQAR